VGLNNPYGKKFLRIDSLFKKLRSHELAKPLNSPAQAKVTVFPSKRENRVDTCEVISYLHI